MGKVTVIGVTFLGYIHIILVKNVFKDMYIVSHLLLVDVFGIFNIIFYLSDR